MDHKFKNAKCVILCGGPGTRLNPITKDLPKSLVPVKGKPILHYIINYWRTFTKEFIFILNYRKDDIIKFVKTLPIEAEFLLESGEPQGIANALKYAKDKAGEHFILVLGDCLCTGDFHLEPEMENGVGVWATDNDEDIKRSYSIELQGNAIAKVIEKPPVLVNRLCGLGFYFFSRAIFAAIDRTKASSQTGRVELTDAIQTLIDSGQPVYPAYLEGQYLNLTYPEDIRRAENIL
jgi:glucose-1-phosphate thymidylyltransferase